MNILSFFNKENINNNASTISNSTEQDAIRNSVEKIGLLENEVAKLKEQHRLIEERLVSLFDEIADAKTCLFQHLNQPKEECQEATITKEELDEETEKTDRVAPPIIIPKDLTIKNYETLVWNIRNNLEKTLGEAQMGSARLIAYYNLSYIGAAMSQVGKEIILIKHSSNRSETERKETKDLLETCKKILEIKKSGDTNGYNKYISFLFEKYPLPADPFQEENPVDFFSNMNFSIYKNCYHLLYFLNKHIAGYTKYNEVYRMKSYKDFFERERMPYEIGLNQFFIECLSAVYELEKLGFELAIIPIMDENIQYRPQSAAQDGKCFSLLFYDKYVENPTLIDGDAAERNRCNFSYSGSTYVSGHYRQGHFRNGHWVSGGFVRGHYRR